MGPAVAPPPLLPPASGSASRAAWRERCACGGMDEAYHHSVSSLSFRLRQRRPHNTHHSGGIRIRATWWPRPLTDAQPQAGPKRQTRQCQSIKGKLTPHMDTHNHLSPNSLLRRLGVLATAWRPPTRFLASQTRQATDGRAGAVASGRMVYGRNAGGGTLGPIRPGNLVVSLAAFWGNVSYDGGTWPMSGPCSAKYPRRHIKTVQLFLCVFHRKLGLALCVGLSDCHLCKTAVGSCFCRFRMLTVRLAVRRSRRPPTPAALPQWGVCVASPTTIVDHLHSM